MITEFNAPAKPGEGLFKDRGSKFIGLAFPVEDEEEVRERLTEVKKRYHDARHYCYAYVLKPDGRIFRANDDGEPNHSAGDPILGQIRSLELTNALVVVVRYFGGTKLGVSGLINAYRSAAREALEQAGSAQRFVMRDYTLSYAYPRMNDVMKLVRDLDLQILEQDFQLECRLRIRVKLSNEEQLLERIPDEVKCSAEL